MKIRTISVSVVVIALLGVPLGATNAQWFNRTTSFDKYACDHAQDVIRRLATSPGQVGRAIGAAVAEVWGEAAVLQCPFVPQSAAEAEDTTYEAFQSRTGLSWQRVLEIIREGPDEPDPSPKPPKWLHDACPITAEEAFAARSTVSTLCKSRNEEGEKKAQAARVKAQADAGCSLANGDACRSAFPAAFSYCVNYGNEGRPQPWTQYRNGEQLRLRREEHCAKALAGSDLCGWDPNVCPGAPSRCVFSPCFLPGRSP